MPKLTVTDMRDAISLYFSKKGQRLTNLQKAPIKKIDEIVSKYNLNMEQLIDDLTKNRAECEIRRQQEKEEQEKRDAEYKKQQEQKKQKKLMMWDTLNEEDKLKVKELQYNRYVDETTKSNIDAKLTTDRMEEMYRKQGLPSFSVVRENDNTLMVRGVHIVNGWISTIKTKEEYFKNVDDDGEYYDFDYWCALNAYNADIILELYKAEMIRDGFWLGEDGEFYKTIKVKVRKTK